jgi:hypothetical protein
MSERPTPEQTQILIRFLQIVFQHVVEPMHLDFVAHLAVIGTLKVAQPDSTPIIDAALAAARADSVLQNSSQRQCRATQEKLVQQVRECSQGAATLEQMMQNLNQVNWN